MELSEATLELLQDEAYACLCREAVAEALASIVRQKAEIASTRPPFGVLALKQTRDAFTRSMGTALDSEATLRDRLAQISGIEEWLRPLLRKDIADYLTAVSPDYRRFQEVRDLLDDWEKAFQKLPEFLVAFARELRDLRQSVGSGPEAGRRFLYALPVVGEAAKRLEQQQQDLPRIAAIIAGLTQGGEMNELRPPVMPEFQRVAWVNRLGVMPFDQAIAEVVRVEQEVRDFLAGGIKLVHARLEVSRDECARLECKVLEQYWNQLRAHAQIHYVEERDVDDVLAMLAQRYASAEKARRGDELLVDPFSTER